MAVGHHCVDKTYVVSVSKAKREVMVNRPTINVNRKNRPPIICRGRRCRLNTGKDRTIVVSDVVNSSVFEFENGVHSPCSKIRVHRILHISVRRMPFWIWTNQFFSWLKALSRGRNIFPVTFDLDLRKWPRLGQVEPSCWISRSKVI